mgnify:CR=1 FL=1
MKDELRDSWSELLIGVGNMSGNVGRKRGMMIRGFVGVVVE